MNSVLTNLLHFCSMWRILSSLLTHTHTIYFVLFTCSAWMPNAFLYDLWRYYILEFERDVIFHVLLLRTYSLKWATIKPKAVSIASWGTVILISCLRMLFPSMLHSKIYCSFLSLLGRATTGAHHARLWKTWNKGRFMCLQVRCAILLRIRYV